MIWTGLSQLITMDGVGKVACRVVRGGKRGKMKVEDKPERIHNGKAAKVRRDRREW
jgi:hypothetical protein